MSRDKTKCLRTKCTGPSSFIGNDKKCHCSFADGFALNNDECVCQHGYILSNHKPKCVKCSGDNAALTLNDKCTCTNTKEFKLSKENECIKCVGIGAKITENNTCECSQGSGDNKHLSKNTFD